MWLDTLKEFIMVEIDVYSYANLDNWFTNGEDQ